LNNFPAISKATKAPHFSPQTTVNGIPDRPLEEQYLCLKCGSNLIQIQEDFCSTTEKLKFSHLFTPRKTKTHTKGAAFELKKKKT